MAVAIIPARFASTRFPGKMLADQTGKALICHVAEHVALLNAVSRLIVATDDVRIQQAVQSAGHEAILTREDHPNGSSRLAQVVEMLDLAGEIIVNVQGDEPEVELKAVAALVARLEQDDTINMATLAGPFQAGEDPSDPNIVKVVVDQQDRALLFSRAAIPYQRDPASGQKAAASYLKHAGVYAYRGWFLQQYVSWQPTPLEQAEKLEQLRVLEHGHDIAIVRANLQSHGIDTAEQYEAFVERFRATSQD
jgi:3-deoxy-manno-octulosonate cytidylyltransferase (CMP-KDO synthetase)